jgi:hypothetical protein
MNWTNMDKPRDIVGIRRGCAEFFVFRVVTWSKVVRNRRLWSTCRWPLKVGRMGSPETSVSNHLTPRNNTEGGRIRCINLVICCILPWNIFCNSDSMLSREMAPSSRRVAYRVHLCCITWDGILLCAVTCLKDFGVLSYDVACFKDS